MIDTLYRMVYGGPPTAGERDRLAASLVGDETPQQIVRRMIGMTDRQTRGTAFLVRFDKADLAVAQIEDLRLVYDKADAAMGGPLGSSGTWEPHLTSFFRRTIRPGMVVADVGANIGFYSLLAARLVGVSGLVFSFEPNSENCRLILLNLEDNDLRNVRLLPLALSTRTGFAYFSSFMGSNGGLLPNITDTLSDPQCVVVPTMPADDVFRDQRVDFIKMDTEGAEGLIVAGASNLIQRDRPVVTSEFSPEMLARVSGVNPADYLKQFKQWGYRIAVLNRDLDRGESEVADVDTFMSDFGPLGHMEDLVFLPNYDGGSSA